ncbi:T9SS type A sorting domain-containing protein [Flavobacterium hauense]
MNKGFLYISLFTACLANAQLSYPPKAGDDGSTAIHKDSNVFVSWATNVQVVRGYVQISDPSISHNGSNYASYGNPETVTGMPDNDAVSLGDAGTAVITFAAPIGNGEGFDFAVFENGSDTFLELAFVEVSSDGTNYFRFPSHSETQAQTPIGGFGLLDARNLNNLAGKYRADYGTPFDLSDIPDNDLLNKNSVTHVKLIDVVGSLEDAYATYDSFGNKINDPYPTPFYSSGFDLAGVGVINTGTLGLNNAVFGGLSIYPNPVTNRLTVKLDYAKNVTVRLYDASGRNVLETLTLNDIDVSDLIPGVYFVELSSDGQRDVKKIVVQ